MSVADEGYEELGFEALEQAVRQSPKGSWFLDEYARRLRSSETSNILDAIAKLERIIASQGHALDAPAQNAPMPAKQLRYFKQDEDIFEQATPAPTVAAVDAAPAAEPKAAGQPPAEQRGARLRILRIEQPVSADPDPFAAAPIAAQGRQDRLPQSSGETRPATAEAIESVADRHRQRIVISRHATPDALTIPLVEEQVSTSGG
jgi:hypothetical protein